MHRMIEIYPDEGHNVAACDIAAAGIRARAQRFLVSPVNVDRKTRRGRASCGDLEKAHE